MSSSAAVPWEEFGQNPRRPENRSMRASDRDREVVLRVLADGFADGRLDRAEYDERADAAAQARTLGDLPDLITDLVPVAPLPVPLEQRALQDYLRDRRNAVGGALTTVVALTAVWWFFGGGFYWPVFFLLVAVGNALRVLTRRDEMVADRLRELEEEQRKAIEKGDRPEQGS